MTQGLVISGYFLISDLKLRIVLRGENAKLYERLKEYKNEIIEDLGEKNLWIVKACAPMIFFSYEINSPR